MSSVDNRIVQMKFDNKQFESGVQTSIKSLDNLKKGLNMDESSRGMSNLEKAVTSISDKFTTLGIIGVTALANITNSIINTGKNLVSSLTVDPIKMGFDEYETKMNAIQTILTNTASKGTTLKDVTATLDELNTYADQTIYNFAEMTRNIGTFTAAGVDLKTSALAIKGIANLAAGSGSNAQQASTAMYQLSQALASGTVKVMDWNSVVNAGMGGELFKKALLDTAKAQKAVETQMLNGQEMIVTYTKKGGKELKSFRDSLEEGWLTSKVLISTLEKFAKDPALLQAATQVKTFTQMLDTMRESVQSGWAQTWETVIGNKDEAAKLFTSINSSFSAIAGGSADARNKMLAFWKANSGRDMLIEGLTNSFKALEGILKPVGEAFREVFPAMTGERLVAITKSFRDLTTHFKMGEETAANLKLTFKGLFAIVDIGKQAISAIGTGFGNLIKNMSPMTGGILSFTGYIGSLLVSLDDTIRKSGAFNLAVEKVGTFLKSISDSIRDSISKITNAFSSFGNIDLSGLDSFSEKVKARFEPISKISDIAKASFYAMAKVLEKIAPVFYKLAVIVGNAFQQLSNNIVSAFQNADYKTIFDLVNGGLLAGIFLGLMKFIKSLTSMTKGAGGFLGGIKEILEGVKESLVAYQRDVKANSLLKIAGAMGILALSLFILSMIDSKKLASSLAAMATMFVELFGSMGVFEKVIGSKGFLGMGLVMLGMVALATAILILSAAVTKLSKIDWEGLTKGLVGVAVLCATLVKTAKSLSGSSRGLIRTSIGLILFAVAINILVDAVKKLGEINTTSLAKGLIGVGVLVTELALFMKVTDLSGMGMFKGVGLILLATSLVILAEAVKKFSQINASSLGKGLLAVGAVLTEVTLFVNMTRNVKHVISTAIGLTILGAAMLIFAKAVENMGNMSWENLTKGLMAMSWSLLAIIATVNIMPKNMIQIGLGLIGISTALVILSKALQNMGSMSWESIAKGLVTLAGSLMIIAVAMQFMKTGIKGAIALLIMSSALAILAGVLKTMGSMKMEEIGKALLTLVGVFTILGLSALILSPLVPVILALSGAIALLGIAVLAIGAGLLAFSAGLTALSISGSAGAAALVIIVTSLLGLIPLALRMLAEGIVAFADVLSKSGPTLVSAIDTLLSSVITAIMDVVPQMIDSGIKLVLGLLKGIADNIGKIGQAGIDIILNFIIGVTSKLPAIIDTAFKLIITFINGLADAIRNNHNAIYDACANLIDAIIDSITDLIPSLFSIGKNIVSGLITGIEGMRKGLDDAMTGVVNGAVDGVKKLLGIHSPSRVFGEIGKFSMLGLANGISDYAGMVANETQNVGDSAVNGLKDAMANIFNAVNGNMDMNPTIRPVLDLTNVASGVGTINSLLSRSQGITVSSANIKAASISSAMRTASSAQNGSSSAGMIPIVTDASVKQPMTLQLMLQNGKAIAEFIIDDVNTLIGGTNKIAGRSAGI